MTTMSQPYIFYSDKCPLSKQVIETIKALNKGGLYKFILVETLARDQIPNFLKKVPTLYNPETKDVVVAKDIFGYIAKPTNSRKELPTKESSVPTQQAVGDLAAWGFSRGGEAMSEFYTDWNSPASFMSDGNSMYTFLGSSSGPISAPAEPQTTNTIKAKGGTDDISARLEALQSQRKNEFSGITRT